MPYNLFLDTEFSAGGHRPLQLLSLGLVTATGAEVFYDELAWNGPLDPWVIENVVPKLRGAARPAPDVSTRLRETLEGVSKGKPIVIWAYNGAYDWVLFCELLGGLLQLPTCVQCPYRELKTYARTLDRVHWPKPHEKHEHHALNDARWNAQLFRAVIDDRAARGLSF